jgi:large subunit ribosomal protein L30
MDQTYIKITLIKSKIGAIPKQRATVEALGLRKLNSSVIQKDNPQIRGMIHKIKHMVKVEPSPNKA